MIESSKYFIYFQNVNIVVLVNSNKAKFFPNKGKSDFIRSQRQIFIHIDLM